ncbi:type II secretion system protein GspN [bacterium AH-315-N03]|nr:type II secretion system protein GspN [bacterium AH-315-N03]
MKNVLLYAVAAPFFFLFSVIFGAYLTFPYDHLRDFIVQEVERGGQTHLQITSLEPSWLTGVEAEGVTVSNVPEGDDEPAQLVIEHVEARVSLLALMGGATEVSFDTALEGGGVITGVFANSEEATHIEAHIERVDLARIGPLRTSIGLPVQGVAQGDVDLTIGAEAVNTEGTANLTIRNLAIGDGEAQLEIEGLGAGLTLERMNLGTLSFRMETERGTTTIEELHADGEHAELWATGSLRLAQQVERSSMDMLFRINFKEAYRTSSGRMEGLFALLEINPQVRPARTSGGSFQWQISGSFGGRIRMIPRGGAPMPEAE